MTLSVSATTQLLADERSSHRRNAPMFTFVPTLRHLVVWAVNVLQDLRNAMFDTYRPAGSQVAREAWRTRPPCNQF